MEGDLAGRVRLCCSSPTPFKTGPSASVGAARAGGVGAFPAWPFEPARSPAREPAEGLAHAGHRVGGGRGALSLGEGEGGHAPPSPAGLGPGGATGVMRGGGGPVAAALARFFLVVLVSWCPNHGTRVGCRVRGRESSLWRRGRARGVEVAGKWGRWSCGK